MFDIDDETKEKLRAQVGIGTLIVFIAMVLVAAIAAGVLINTAGFLQSKSEETGQQSGEQVTNRLQVLQASGEKTSASFDSSPRLGAVNLVVTKAPGAEDIALRGITMQWVDDTGTYDLVHEHEYEGNVDGAFAQTAIKDEDGSIRDATGEDGSPVINSGDDRVNIVIDVGAKDVGGSGSDLSAYETDPTTETDGTILRENSGGLEEGETASIRITTASSTASTVQLVVPESLSGKTAVRL
ncbi:archaellin/type IV pilin N-terminal domain-containing protein [Halorientalis salina]|uniref:archaellin/type IV pilin N-terminal domain-containing protein n=1 Tax=Halorientalis salina TaxID=2932266 RepID=UPI0010AD5B64|nr:archaellin/type IV pilin N-terminal domain-containing protein [Halorientalis salina]